MLNVRAIIVLYLRVSGKLSMLNLGDLTMSSLRVCKRLSMSNLRELSTSYMYPRVKRWN